MRFGEKRKKERLGVDEIVKTLVEMSINLEEHNVQKNEQIQRLENNKSEIDNQIGVATTEQKRGEKIFSNIKQILDV